MREMFLTSEDITRCHGSLSKLARHLKEPVVLTGGIAVGWHLLGNGAQREKRHLNDIDIVVEGLSGLCSSLSKHFLIAHFHPTRERGKILIQLVDEEYRTRIDLFTPSSNSLIERLLPSVLGNVACRFVSIEDLLSKLLSIIYPAMRNEPVEPKYVEQFRLLSALAVPDRIREVWLEYRKESQPSDFEEAAEAVRLSLKRNPGLLQTARYCQDINYECPWCCESEVFQLAPRARIYKILGYV